VRSSIVLRRDLDVLLARAPILVFPFDADIGKVNLFVEVRKVVSERPVLDLVLLTVGTPVAVVAVSIALLQEALVLALELVVEHGAPNTPVALGNALRGALVGSIDLDVVGELPRLPDAGVEGLAGTLARVAAVLLEELTPFLRQRHHVVAPASQAGGFNQAGFPEMPQVAAARVQWLTVMIAEIARADYAEGADGRQRATLRSAKLVRAVPQRDLLPLALSRQIQVAHEHVAGIDASIALLGRPSTAPLPIVAFPVTVSRIVERVVSVEHRRCPSRQRRRA
jgi:hypothetical protein